MQVVAPYVPGMSARHRRIFVLHTSFGECLTGSNAILVSDVFLAAHIEFIKLEALVHGCGMFL